MAASPRPRRTHWRADRRVFLQTLLASGLTLSARVAARQAAPSTAAPALDPEDGAYHVYPGGRIQDALDAAARDHVNKMAEFECHNLAAPGDVLVFEGVPNMQRLNPVRVGETVPEQLQLDLELEYAAVKRLNDGIAACVAASPLDVGNHQVPVSVTVGVATILRGDTIEDVARRGQLVMHKAKAR